MTKQVFTPEQVERMNAHQTEGFTHGFTCKNRGDGNHGYANGDLGGLVATVRGWVCAYCDYSQDWAHDFQKETWPVNPFTGETVGRSWLDAKPQEAKG